MNDVEQRCCPDVIKFLVANKCDLDEKRRVFYEDLQTKAETFNIDNMMETSAISAKRESCAELFKEVVN